MKLFLGFLILLNHLAMGAPTKIEGTFDQYSRADRIVVYYQEKEAAKKACEREGLKIVREDEDLKFFVASFAQSWKISNLISLASENSVESISPSVKEKRFFDAKKPFLGKVNLSDLDKEETDQLQVIKNRPSVAEVFPVKYASDALFMIRSLEIPLVNQKPLEIRRYDFKDTPRMFSISAVDIGLSLTISISNNNVFGVFYTQGKTYAIEPLGRGHQAIILLK